MTTKAPPGGTTGTRPAQGYLRNPTSSVCLYFFSLVLWGKPELGRRHRAQQDVNAPRRSSTFCQSWDYGIDPSLHPSFSAPRRPENHYPSSQVRKRLTRTSGAAGRGDNETPTAEGAQASQTVSFKFWKIKIDSGGSKLDSFGTKGCGKPGLGSSVPVPAASFSLLPQCVHLQKGETIYSAWVLDIQNKTRLCGDIVALLISSGSFHEGEGRCTYDILTTGHGRAKNGEKNHKDQTVTGLLLPGPITQGASLHGARVITLYLSQ